MHRLIELSESRLDWISENETMDPLTRAVIEVARSLNLQSILPPNAPGTGYAMGDTLIIDGVPFFLSTAPQNLRQADEFISFIQKEGNYIHDYRRNRNDRRRSL
jgi:hypothetical protein